MKKLIDKISQTAINNVEIAAFFSFELSDNLEKTEQNFDNLSLIRIWKKWYKYELIGKLDKMPAICGFDLCAGSGVVIRVLQVNYYSVNKIK